MELFKDISPLYFATVILISSTGFTLLWFLDSLTHKKLVKVDITDKELQTHRNILVVSILMEISLVSMYWYNLEALPFFITFLIVRTVHEFIDELHFHTNRCSAYESRLHLGMWVFIFIKTITLFFWGFFSQYTGLEDLPIIYYFWAGIVLVAMSIISFFEWNRG